MMKRRPACCRYASLAAIETFMLELSMKAEQGEHDFIIETLLDEDKMERLMNTLSRADNLYHEAITQKGDDFK